MGLEFKKKSKILGIIEGYYFKNELLSRYKTEAIQILRNRIEEAGSKVGDKSKNDWEKGKEIMIDEAKIIYDEYEKATTKNQRTHEKKKPYYEEIHNRVLRRRIYTLKDKIEYKEIRKQEIIKHFDNKIQEIKKEISQIEQELNKSEEEKVGF